MGKHESQKKWFRLLAAFSGTGATAVGVLLAVKAPSLLIEHATDSSYSLTRITHLPILPAIMVILGTGTFALALREYRHLSLLTSLCLGLVITSLTFIHCDMLGLRVAKYGYPLGCLAWIVPPRMFGEPRIMGVVALPFLIDLALWSLITWVIIMLSVNRIKARFILKRHAVLQ